MGNGGSDLGELSSGSLLQGVEDFGHSTSSHKGPHEGGITWHAAYLEKDLAGSASLLA